MSESCVASASGSRVSVEQNAERLYKWGTLLQLETEAKARLRPFMAMLGLSVAQDDVREGGVLFCKELRLEVLARAYGRTCRHHQAAVLDSDAKLTHAR